MSLDFLLKDPGFIRDHDTYSSGALLSDASNRVHIYCEGKNRSIWGVLSEGFTIKVTSKWQSLFGGAIGGEIGPKVLDILDNVDQIVRSRSIRQPYFGRKYWVGTSPLQLSIVFQFVSFLDAKTEVYDPMISLLSLVYPRLSRTSSTAGMIEDYFIPGPNLLYQAGKRGLTAEGDRVEITMGSFLKFQGCYITQITAKVENSFSSDGFPNCINVTLDFEAMDAAYVYKDGSFMENGFRDASVDLGTWGDKLQSFTQSAVDGTKKAVGKMVEKGKQGYNTIADLFHR